MRQAALATSGYRAAPYRELKSNEGERNLSRRAFDAALQAELTEVLRDLS